MISGISDRGVFTRLRSDGMHVRSKDLRFRYLDDVVPEDDRPVQIAYSISRKVGNAVTRNRLRRRLRALFEESVATSSPFSAAIVIVLPGAAGLDFAGLREQVWEIMQKVEKSRTVPT